MSWWEDGARAESSSAPFADGFDVPEALDPADVCPACNDLRCLPTCRRYVEPAPLADSIEGIRELQRAIGESA